MRLLVCSKLFALVFGASLAVSSGAAQPVDRGPMQTVERVDLERYMGRWYEAALIPNKFQSMCVADTSATYALLPNGRVSVTNRCRQKDNSITVAEGEARPAEPGGTTKLQVRFAPRWLAWLDAVWGDYWVIGLDADYRWALVGEPSREFLWLLSRTPELDAASRDVALAIAKAQGYELSRVQMSKQSQASK